MGSFVSAVRLLAPVWITAFAEIVFGSLGRCRTRLFRSVDAPAGTAIALLALSCHPQQRPVDGTYPPSCEKKIVTAETL